MNSTASCWIVCEQCVHISTNVHAKTQVCTEKPDVYAIMQYLCNYAIIYMQLYACRKASIRVFLNGKTKWSSLTPPSWCHLFIANTRWCEFVRTHDFLRTQTVRSNIYSGVNHRKHSMPLYNSTHALLAYSIFRGIALAFVAER